MSMSTEGGGCRMERVMEDGERNEGIECANLCRVLIHLVEIPRPDRVVSPKLTNHCPLIFPKVAVPSSLLKVHPVDASFSLLLLPHVVG